MQDADGNVVTGAAADAVATLGGTMLTLIAPGTVTVTALQIGGDISGTIYAAATQRQTITVMATPPTIRRVTTAGDAGNDGSSWANAMTLQAALAASTMESDQVWIAAGTYKPHTTNRRRAFGVRTGVVYGGFVGDEAADFDPATTARTGAATILSGDLMDDDGDDPTAPGYAATRDDNSNTVVYILGANATLDGLTITGGAGGEFGGGLTAEFFAPDAVVRNCRFTNNSVRLRGGGAYFETPATLINCVFEDNSTTGRGVVPTGGGWEHHRSWHGGCNTTSDATVVFASTDINNATEDDYLRLVAGSPAANAGEPNDYIPTSRQASRPMRRVRCVFRAER